MNIITDDYDGLNKFLIMLLEDTKIKLIKLVGNIFHNIKNYQKNLLKKILTMLIGILFLFFKKYHKLF